MNTHRNSRQQQSFQSEKKAVLNTKNQKSPYLFDEAVNYRSEIRAAQYL